MFGYNKKDLIFLSGTLGDALIIENQAGKRSGVIIKSRGTGKEGTNTII
jgi:hypothetical protein